MLSIRSEQMSDLSRAMQAGFEDEFLASLHQAYPRQMLVFGEDAARAFVHLEMERAFDHGIDERRSCARYIALALMLGAFFDIDPQLPWVAQTLEDTQLSDERKVDRLRLAAARYSTTVTGPDNAYLHAAFEQMHTQAHQGLATSGQGGEHLFSDLMRNLYPEKYATLTSESLKVFSEEALRKGSEYHLTDPMAMQVLAALMFLLGSGCDRDPLYPWIDALLRDRSMGPATKGDRLLDAARTYLQQVVDAIDPGA